MVKPSVRETIKTLMQRVLLPAVYRLSEIHFFKKRPIQKGLVVLADAHHDTLPYSMQELERALRAQPEFTVRVLCTDYQKGSYFKTAASMLRFMRMYASAEFVVICDNHLPVASCKKRRETKVIQLWHSGGALKRFGYDSPGNIPASYHGGNVYANYDLITVSAPYAVQPFVRAMRTASSCVQVTGISRTDWFFDAQKRAALRARFYELHPHAAGKTVLLWAPTFRGSAAAPQLVGEEALQTLQQQLPDDCVLFVKLHPHAQKKQALFAEAASPMLTEELLAVTDILISDYSSIIYDFAYFEKPLILFTPDFEQYQTACGFYEDYEAIPAFRAMDAAGLLRAVGAAKKDWQGAAAMRAFWQRTMSACDGHATERIVQWMREHRE